MGGELGPILWQLPATMAFDPERIERFLGLLSRDSFAAARLAEHRNRGILKGRGLLEPAILAPIRHALEVRHDSFRDRHFIDLLRRQNVALVISDAPGWPRFREIGADFVYVRLHGASEIYASGYDAPALAAWARRVRRWATAADDGRGRDVFLYFDNDAKIRAPADARALAERLGLTPQGRTGAPAETEIALQVRR